MSGFIKVCLCCLMFVSVRSILAETQANIDNAGVGSLSCKGIRVTVTEQGVIGISTRNGDVCEGLFYQALSRQYKSLLDLSKDIASSEKLKLQNGVITAEQILKKQNLEAKCIQKVMLDDKAVLTVEYSVFPEKLTADVIQQRITLAIRKEHLGKSTVVVDSKDNAVKLETFSFTGKNTDKVIFTDQYDRKWSLSVKALNRDFSFLMQLYPSYLNFVNIVFPGRDAYALEFKFDLSGLLAEPVKTATVKPSGNELSQSERAALPEQGINLLQNGSFEFGMNDWKPGSSSYGENAYWQIVEDGVDNKCLKYVGDSGPYSVIFSLLKDRNESKIFTVAADLKGTRENQKVKIGLMVAPVEGRTRADFRLFKVFETGKSWRRYSATFRLPDSWKMDKICMVLAPEKSDQPFYADNAELIPNAATCKKSPAQQFDLVLDTKRAGHIFTLGMPANISGEMRNISEKENTYRIDIERVDAWGNGCAVMTKDLTVKAKGKIAFDIPVNSNERGYYTLKYTLKDRDGNVKDGIMPYCVITDNSKLDRSMFGMNFHMHIPEKEQLDTALSILSKMGFGSIRAWWDWGIVEARRDSFDWSKIDYQVDLCEKNNLEITPVLLRMYGPSWSIPNLFQNPPDDLTLWDRYVKNTVTRYKGRVKYWEIWNEPDASPVLKYKPELYFQVLKRSANIIRETDPDAKVVGICGSFFWFIEPVLSAGGLKYADIISYHCYNLKYNPGVSLVPWVEKLRKLIAGYNNDKQVPLWNTEVGIGDDRGGYILSEENALRSCGILVRNYVAAYASETRRLYWFAAELASLYSHSLFDYDFIPTPAMVAFNAMSDQLAGAKYTGRIELPGNDNFFVFSFLTRDNKSLAVAWANGFPVERRLQFDKKSHVEMFDIMGKRLTLENNSCQLLATFPIYIYAENAEKLKEAIASAKVTAVEKAQHDEVVVGKAVPPQPTTGPFSLTNDGMVIDWLLFGPFANPGGRGYDKGLDTDYLLKLGGEKQINFNTKAQMVYTWPSEMKHYLKETPDKTVVKPLEYHGASVADYYGKKEYINLLNLLTPSKYSVGYAFCYVEAPEAVNIKIKIGSDDGCKIFLNHQQIWRNKMYRGAKKDEDVIEASLKKGLNSFLVKIEQDSGDWGFFCRLTDQEDKPLKNIKIWL